MFSNKLGKTDNRNNTIHPQVQTPRGGKDGGRRRRRSRERRRREEWEVKGEEALRNCRRIEVSEGYSVWLANMGGMPRTKTGTVNACIQRQKNNSDPQDKPNSEKKQQQQEHTI